MTAEQALEKAQALATAARKAEAALESWHLAEGHFGWCQQRSAGFCTTPNRCSATAAALADLRAAIAEWEKQG